MDFFNLNVIIKSFTEKLFQYNTLYFLMLRYCISTCYCVRITAVCAILLLLTVLSSFLVKVIFALPMHVYSCLITMETVAIIYRHCKHSWKALHFAPTAIPVRTANSIFYRFNLSSQSFLLSWFSSWKLIYICARTFN